MTETKFHPALAVNNVKNFISITLEMEKGHSSSWAELFKIHCRAYQVIDHIIPPTQRTSEPAKEKAVARDDELWSHLDAINRILLLNKHGSDCIIFYKTIRILELSTWKINSLMFIWMIFKLFLPIVKNSKCLPINYQMLVHQYRINGLILEETRKAKQTAASASAAGIALFTANNSTNESKGSYSGSVNALNRHNTTSKRGQNRNNNRGKDNGNRGRGRSGNNHANGGSNHTQQSQQRTWQQQPQQWGQYPLWGWAPQPWADPPCPYPTSSWTRPPPARQPSILGNRPQQAYAASVPTSSSYDPTEIEQAMHTMTLNTPDTNWYMDTGATSHMTASPSNLSSYFNMSNSKTNLPPPHPPLHLNNVLHAPKLIKNLIYMCRFTIDNNISIAFDPFGFSVKDF
ncbi:uncharacterized protein LOC125370302 [Ricinus communis]|uniref:uncharacterized protein LOC125370302 n=1 Tax=Ricinus communis TaxID=3988 RepID=UPI00201A877C|nr:uncharacterized protein LOC125370302 [Ricinus communis]